MPSKPAEDFLGIGWAFPVTASAGADVGAAEYEEDVRQAVRIILETSNDRIMRPDYGAGLRALLFEPMNTATLALVRHRAEQALVLWEPRIDSVAVDVQADGPNGRLMIEVTYRVRATNTFYNLVYPFYLSEARTT